MSRGFTVVEMVVYIALLTLIMGGALAATYELLSGQGSANAHNTTEEEGSFVLGKFFWAMGQITATSTPSAGNLRTHDLDITTAEGRVQMCRTGSAIWIREGGAGGICGDTSYVPITTSNVKVTGLDFTYLPAASGGPDGIEASTTLDGQTFRTVRYLRK